MYVANQSIFIKETKNPFALSQCTLSLPPEDIRKPNGFLIVSRGRERVHWNEWANRYNFALFS